MFLDRPCSSESLILTTQIAQIATLIRVEVRKGAQPRVFRTFQSRSFESLVTHHSSASQVDRLGEICRDMKLVKDDLAAGVRHMRDRRLKVWLPHVHSNGF